MQSIPTIVVAPPPTPNGDLHVGHLSGPYLGADVLRRYCILRKDAVISALSVDTNQTYVVTTAERLGKDPESLVRESHEKITATLTAARIEFDTVGMPDTPYGNYVSAWFRRLFESGALSYRRRAIPFDTIRNRFMFESYASGCCPVCITDTRGNICEACGHPNEARNLMLLHPTGGTPEDPVELREIGEYCLDMESLRAPLAAHLQSEIPEKRPGLARLIDEIFSAPLLSFPITFPSEWGIPAPFPESKGMVLNVWAEMVPGHYYWIDEACRKKGLSPLIASAAPVRYVQYLGFDNSFFYTIAHLALALSAVEAGIEAILPNAFITNEFYLLENYKFSTSEGHLLWGRDLLEEMTADDVRFFLAWSNPEYSQANFTHSDMENIVETKFRKPMNYLVPALDDLPSGDEVEMNPYGSAILERFESAYSIRRQSLRQAAQTVANGLNLLVTLFARNATAGVLRSTARAVACGMAPIAPEAAVRLWRASKASGPIRWPTTP